MHIIRLLGAAGICETDGTATSRGIPRARMAVLAVLALSRTRSVARDRLMAILWPESDTARARHQLREALYRLRETLGDGTIVGSGDHVHLEPSLVRCDAWDFEDAVARNDWLEADRLYTGQLLDGFFLSGAAEFERWVDAQRTRFLGMHRATLEAAASDCASRSDWARAATLWRRCIEADPYSANATVGLMTALATVGDRAGALRCAAEHETLLKADLDAEPEAAVVVLADQLRRATATDPVPTDGRETFPSASGDGPRARESRSASDATDVHESMPSPRRSPRWRVALPAALATLLVVAGFIRARGVDARDGLDTARLVIMPFRVSGADSSLAFLRDGLVELLSTQFTGGYGPTAVDAGEVLRAQSHDASPEPVTPNAARRFGEQLHAGQVLYGSIVGTARQLVISASILQTVSGVVDVGPVSVSGPLDSLSMLVAQLSTRLLARQAGVDSGEHASTEALQSFVRGMAAYRRANWIAAGTELFRAFEIDSAFTPAAYRFALVHAVTAPMTPLGERPTRDPRFTRLYSLLWKQRHRLSVDHRRLVEAVADSLYVRWPMQSLPKLETLVTLLPNSVEAWDVLGDDYYHAGAVIGRENWLARAKAAFEHATAIDSTIAVNAAMHLPDIAFIAGDAASRSSMMSVGRDTAFRRYQAALLSGNAGRIHNARVDYAKAWARGDAGGVDWAVQGVSIARQELDSLLLQLDRSSPAPEQRRLLDEWSIAAAMMSGRTARADELLRRVYGADTSAIDLLVLSYASSTPVAESRVLSSVRLAKGIQEHPEACNVALARLRRGDTTDAVSILATEPAMDDRLPASEVVMTVRRGPVAQAAICGQVLRGVLASFSPSEDRWLLRGDSVMRHLQLNYAVLWNYDVALALARRGYYKEAAAAARRRFIDRGPIPRLVPSLRNEARWAALAGDTAHAVAAYRHYLLWRDNPDASLRPQRDSVRQELTALLKAR